MAGSDMAAEFGQSVCVPENEKTVQRPFAGPPRANAVPVSEKRLIYQPVVPAHNRFGSDD